MHKLRSITIGLGALALAGFASAQFTGPAPLAWRWIQSTTVAPSSSPLVVGSTVYQSEGGRIFSIDRDSGNLNWRYPALDPIDGNFRSAPVEKDGVLYAVGDNKLVYAFDAKTGETKWTQVLLSGALGAPVLVGKYLMISQSDNSIVALKIEDGSMAWGDSAPTYKVFEGIAGPMVASGRDVVFANGRNQLISLNVDRRELDWHLNFEELPPNATPTLADGSLYVNSGPFLISVNPSNGRARAPINTQLNLAYSPVSNGECVFIVSQDGKAMAYDPGSKRPLTTSPIDLGSLPIARPTPVGQKFIVLTSNGGVNLIDPKKTTPEWSFIIRPLADVTENTNTSPGGRGRGGFGGNQTSNTPKKITSVQGAAPAVLSGQTLLVPAKDGSLLAFDKDLGVDLTPPKITMLFPNPGDQVSGQPPLILAFKITDESSGLKTDTLAVTINGQPVNCFLDKDGTVLVRFVLTGVTAPKNGKYVSLSSDAWLGNRQLLDGRKEIAITAADWMGNEITKVFSFTIDNTLRPIVLPGQETNTTNSGGGNGKGGGGAPGGGGGGG
jgi:outer membrane protein assembly factor BamB